MKTNNPVLDQALKEETQKQYTSLRINFDQAIEEEREKAIIIEWQGEEYKVPDRAPEWLRLLILSNKVISDEDNEKIFRKLFGDDFADRLEKEIESNNYLNMAMANETLIAPLIDKWFGAPIIDTTKKKKTQGSSSGRGGKSKRTSSGTTG